MQPHTFTMVRTTISSAAFVAGFMISIGFLTILVPKVEQITRVDDDYYENKLFCAPHGYLPGIALFRVPLVATFSKIVVSSKN